MYACIKQRMNVGTYTYVCTKQKHNVVIYMYVCRHVCRPHLYESEKNCRYISVCMYTNQRGHVAKGHPLGVTPNVVYIYN